MKGNGDLSGTSSPVRAKKSRPLLVGVISLILGVSILVLMGLFSSPYASCGYFDFMCTRRLKTSSELFSEYVGPVFLVIIGSLIIIGYVLSRSAVVQESVRDWRQRQRPPREKKYDLEDEN